MQGRYDAGMETLGLRVRRLRQAQGLSVATLAEKCGLPAGEIHELEAGRVEDPELSVGLRLADSLHVDPWVLALGEGGPNDVRLLHDRIGQMTYRPNVAKRKTDWSATIEGIVVESLRRELERIGFSVPGYGGADVDFRLHRDGQIVGVIECKSELTPSLDLGKLYCALGQVMYYGRAAEPGLPLAVCFFPSWPTAEGEGDPFLHSPARHVDMSSRLQALDVSLIFAWGANTGTARTIGLEQYAARVSAYARTLQEGDAGVGIG